MWKLLSVRLVVISSTCTAEQIYLTSNPPTLPRLCEAPECLDPTDPHWIILALFFSRLNSLTVFEFIRHEKQNTQKKSQIKIRKVLSRLSQNAQLETRWLMKTKVFNSPDIHGTETPELDFILLFSVHFKDVLLGQNCLAFLKSNYSSSRTQPHQHVMRYIQQSTVSNYQLC